MFIFAEGLSNCGNKSHLTFANDNYNIISSMYQWSLFPPEAKIDAICNHSVCRDGQNHTICQKRHRKDSNCKDFKFLQLDFKNRRRFVMSHNGLRNRISKMSGWFATNMNYVVSSNSKKNES